MRERLAEGIVLILIVVAILMRAPGVSGVCIYVDEWIYWLKTNWILANNWIPTARVFDYSPPFLSHIGAAVTILFGGELSTLRTISVVFGSLTIPLMYSFGRAIYDRKTGLLAALFLCFSAYHCLYSHIYMLEALTLFFITAFLYFFWQMQRYEGNEKSKIYAILAGMMMGLAFDAKYISFFLIPVVFVYILWVNRLNFRALIDKKIILMFFFAFLFFLPLLVCLFYTGVYFHGFSHYAIERFEGVESRGTVVRPIEFSLGELLERGVGRVLEVLTWGADAGIFSPIYACVFKISTILLLLITLSTYIHHTLIREKKGSFLVISTLIISISILLIGNTRHYLIYLFPFFYVMFSHIFVESLNLRNRGKKQLRIFISIVVVISVIIMLLFSSISAFTESFWDKGEYNPWIENAVDFIMRDIKKNNYEEENISVGIVFETVRVLDYQLYLSESNISIFRLLEPGKEYSGEFATLNLEAIELLKPDYIVIGKACYDIYFKGEALKDVLEDYIIAFSSHDYPYGCFVLRRKKTQVSGLTALERASTKTADKRGKIFKDIFEKSVPSVMKVGEVYKAEVRVKNTGNSRTNFTIFVHSNDYILFVEDAKHSITLDKGSTFALKFKLLPIKEYAGELPITVDLYARSEKNKNIMKKVDSVTDYVYFIRK